MHKDINNQIQIVYLIIFQISYIKSFAYFATFYLIEIS